MVKAVIQSPDIIRVAVNSPLQPRVPSVGISTSSFTLSNLSNVDVSNLTNGSVLVYKATTEKWTSTTLLEQQDIDSGEF